MNVKTKRMLDEYTVKFFPRTGHWSSDCFKRPKDLKPWYFPCHTRDNDWLASLYYQKFMEDNKFVFVLPSTIVNYVQTSELFDKERCDYEQRVVKWQIDWIMKDGENWIVDSELGGELYIFSSKVDLAVRKGVVDTLLAIGMNIDVVEEGIEKNASKWKNQCFDLAYTNTYGLDANKDIEFKKKWMKLHQYEYYQMHKDSVDKYGEVLPEMMMSDEEAMKLKKYIDEVGSKKIQESQPIRYVIPDDNDFVTRKLGLESDEYKVKQKKL